MIKGPSNHFPPVVRDMLVMASEVPQSEGDPFARPKAINRAIAWARWHYPDYFREDDDELPARRNGTTGQADGR